MTEFKEFRERFGLSRVQVAKILGCSESAVKHYENGRRDIPGDAESFGRLHDALSMTDKRVTSGEFVGWRKTARGSMKAVQIERERCMALVKAHLTDRDPGELLEAIRSGAML